MSRQPHQRRARPVDSAFSQALGNARRHPVGRYVPRAAQAHPKLDDHHTVHKGRGATFNPANRYDSAATEGYDDGWGVDPAADAPAVRTRIRPENARSIVSTNTSPDIGFDRSVNPYKGCEHGCVYCYARPTHAYLGLSPGLDFETRIVSKPNAAALLRKKLSGTRYTPQTIVIGANTDAYQPIERELGITRALIEVLAEFRHPFSIITKSQGVLRDLDVLRPLGRAGLCRVMVSITSVDPQLSRLMEPRASHPDARFRTVRELTDAGVPTGVMTAPMIPAINDDQLERIIERAAAAGADTAGYVAVRLPLEIKELFEGWLDVHFKGRKARVLGLIRQMRGGELYTAQFGTRMRGTGVYADLLSARFRAATARFGLDRPPLPLDVTQFKVPPKRGEQLGLWG